MASALEAPADKLIASLTQELKKVPEIKPPAWMAFVKSGSQAERKPDSPDFWYARCASLLRTLYKENNKGVGRLRTKYGKRKSRGSRPEKHRDASGNIIRKALQQLEKAGFVKKIEKKGRTLTPKGKSLLDKTARGLKQVARKRIAPIETEKTGSAQTTT